MKTNLHYTIFVIAFYLFPVLTSTSQNFAWAKAFGGTNGGSGNSIAVDASGNVYTTGTFAGTTDFDPGIGIYNLISAGNEDIFISKLDGSGNFIWAKRIGNTSFDGGISIALDGSGNIYVTGYFTASTVDFDPGPGVFNLTTYTNSRDIFILKLDPLGNFIWAKTMGGLAGDFVKSLKTDGVGNIYTTGYFAGTSDFDPSASTSNLTSAGSYDIFVSKLDPLGNFVWAKSMGGLQDDNGHDLAVDAGGNVYTTGSFWFSADFDPGIGTFSLTSAGGTDIFISKLDASGNFIWAKQLGGSSTTNDMGKSLINDSSGNIYCTGFFGGTADFDPSTNIFNLTSMGVSDIFISKLDSTGNLMWAKAIGGTGVDYSSSISLDGLGNVFTTGYFRLTADFDPGAGVYNLTSTGSDDIFISKLDANGNFAWAGSMTGSNLSDFGNSITVDGSGNIYTTGYFQGTLDFDPGAGVFNLSTSGSNNVFVHKMSSIGIGINENSVDLNNAIVYPNPFSSSVTIKFEKKLDDATMTVINSIGKEVKRLENIFEQEIIFKRDNLPSGLYILSLVQNNKVTSRIKLIITD